METNFYTRASTRAFFVLIQVTQEMRKNKKIKSGEEATKDVDVYHISPKKEKSILFLSLLCFVSTSKE